MPTLLSANFMRKFLLRTPVMFDSVVESNGVLQDLSSLVDDVSVNVNKRAHCVQQEGAKPSQVKTQVLADDDVLRWHLYDDKYLTAANLRNFPMHKFHLESCMDFLAMNGWINSVNIGLMGLVAKALHKPVVPAQVFSALHPEHTQKLGDSHTKTMLATHCHQPDSSCFPVASLLRDHLHQYRFRGFKGNPVFLTDFKDADMARFRQMVAPALLSDMYDIPARFPYDFKGLWTEMCKRNPVVKSIDKDMAKKPRASLKSLLSQVRAF